MRSYDQPNWLASVQWDSAGSSIAAGRILLVKREGVQEMWCLRDFFSWAVTQMLCKQQKCLQQVLKQGALV